ncbi:MAG: hypothetical protein EZS28_041087 [Streblomastix strix]|uniref:Uncharacterized protein n=1 Tax=Streblomastix strix TaxID=222440 RepID=A0A5J4TY18_9EUKA|nr:MAG: hypothetical protein EZS28_041087 [Streblomastix strix]
MEENIRRSVEGKGKNIIEHIIHIANFYWGSKITIIQYFVQVGEQKKYRDNRWEGINIQQGQKGKYQISYKTSQIFIGIQKSNTFKKNKTNKVNQGRVPPLLWRRGQTSLFHNSTRQTTKATTIMPPTKRTITTNNGNTQNFSTNPYTESMQKLKSQGKLALKVTGYTLLSVTAATALIWQSYHWYIEYYLSRSPASLNYKAKLLLHGAYFREHVVPDYGMAAFYLEKVLQLALEEQQLDEQHSDMIQLRLRLAFDEWQAGHLFDAITQYTRAWTLLVATTPSSSSETATTAKHQEDMISTAKYLGDLYTKVGDNEKAEEFLTWAFYAVTKPTSDILNSNDNSNSDNNGLILRKINIICSLASLYAMQRQFHLALPMFLQALQLIPENDKDSRDVDDGKQWLCMKAILQNQLSETFYGMGKSDESMGWAQASLSSSSDGMAKYKNSKDCRECGGVVSNNLGKLLEVSH